MRSSDGRHNEETHPEHGVAPSGSSPNSTMEATLIDEGTTHYRVPKEDGKALVRPSGDLQDWILKNGESFRSATIRALRPLARRELLRLAVAHMQSYSDESPALSAENDVELIIGGHQPELFHPGVWFKNFLLAAVAAKRGRDSPAVAVNLVIDSDDEKSTAILVPTGRIEAPEKVSIGYDRADRILPFERQTWCQTGLAFTFPQRVHESVSSVSQHSLLVDDLWKELSPWINTDYPRGASLALARHRLEQRHGLRNLEVPISQLCATYSFAAYLGLILSRCEEFLEIHNSSLGQYRSAYGLRSRTHPVPDLVRGEEWLEMPFWIWSDESPQRGPLYVRRTGETIEVSDRDSIHFRVDSTNLAEALFDRIKATGPERIAIRPRALTTTLFARMFLADLFVHGIGGAKYDEVTNLIIREFFGVRPPTFLTATSTHSLPVSVERRPEGEAARLQNQLRSTYFHPEEFQDRRTADDGESLLSDADYQEILAAKNKLLQNIPPKGKKKGWHQEMERINAELARGLDAFRNELRNRRSSTVESRKKTSLLLSREFSFVLHPPELIDLLKQLACEELTNVD